MNGKQILEDLDKDAVDAGIPSCCPFSGLAKGVGAVSLSHGEKDSLTAGKTEDE